MQKLPTGDAIRVSHKTVQFWQLANESFCAPFDDEDDDEYPVSLFSFPVPRPKRLISCDIAIALMKYSHSVDLENKGDEANRRMIVQS